MLAINREPLYKNRLVLSGLAVFSGFLITVGIVRTLAPANEQASQTAQSTEERRSRSLVPIKASGSESSSESGSGATQASETTGPASGQQPVASPWVTPSTQNGSNSSSPSTQTPQDQPTSQASNPASSPAPAQPAPSQPTCTVGLLNQLICI